MSQKTNTSAARIGEIQKTIERGWNIPDEFLDELPAELGRMVFETYTDPDTKREEHDEPGQVRIQAIKLILEMKKQNIAEGLPGNGKTQSQADDDHDHEAEVDPEAEVENRRSNILEFIRGKSKAGDDAGRNRTAGSGTGKAARRKTAARKPAKKQPAKRKA
jgi:hypothetical protein